MLDTEFNYYKKNQKALLKKYQGKVLVIKGEEVVGVCDDEASAYQDAVSKYELGTFLIQNCRPEEEMVQTFHSRVIFA